MGRIIKKHNGDIRIRSEPGQGAAFIIELPIIQQYTSQIIKKPQVKIVDEETILSQKQILIVDDEPVIIELLSRILSAEGYLTDVADNGKTAIEKIKNNNYDLIISDIRMPGTDGKEIYRYLEQNKPDMTERIIFTTGDNSNDGTAEFFNKIKTPHLTKPFKLMNVKTLINDVFMNRSAPETDHYNSANISSAVSTSLK